MQENDSSQTCISVDKIQQPLMQRITGITHNLKPCAMIPSGNNMIQLCIQQTDPLVVQFKCTELSTAKTNQISVLQCNGFQISTIQVLFFWCTDWEVCIVKLCSSVRIVLHYQWCEPQGFVLSVQVPRSVEIGENILADGGKNK